MSIEPKRECGYRQVGGTYLTTSLTTSATQGFRCDRLPLAIVPCPTCGEQPRFNRGIGKIWPEHLWAIHSLPGRSMCPDLDPICQPGEKAYLMWVGSEYTTRSFMVEAQNQGISKRVPRVPTDLVLGEDWIFLAKMHCIAPVNYTPDILEMINLEGRGWQPGIFYAFQPTAIERIVTENQASQGIVEELAKIGITAIVVPDADKDHNPRHKDGDGVGTEEEED